MDKRIEKTLTNLNIALFTLLQKTPYDKIGVNDLCELANIKRPTFYNHFENKDDYIKKGFEFHIRSIIKRDNLTKVKSTEDFIVKIVKGYIKDITPYRRKGYYGFENDFNFPPQNALSTVLFEVLLEYYNKKNVYLLDDEEKLILLMNYSNIAITNIIYYFFNDDIEFDHYISKIKSLKKKLNLKF